MQVVREGNRFLEGVLQQLLIEAIDSLNDGEFKF
jgi:hypothetical protein